MEKRCSKCGETKPGEEFGTHPATRDKLGIWCRACRKAYRSARYHSMTPEQYTQTLFENNQRRADPKFRIQAAHAQRERRRNLTPEQHAKELETNRRYKKKLRDEAFTHYGNGILECLWCAEDDIEVLTLDHVDNDGKKHRRDEDNANGRYFYGYLKKHGWPKLPRLQLICTNCNIAKVKNNGVLPPWRKDKYRKSTNEILTFPLSDYAKKEIAHG